MRRYFVDVVQQPARDSSGFPRTAWVPLSGMASDALLEAVLALTTDPLNWEGWVGVPKTAQVGALARADALDISTIRMVYDAFLAVFPLTYGYWKKLAEHEWKYATSVKPIGGAADTTATRTVYERSVASAPHESACWLNYADFAVKLSGDAALVRSVFERGVRVVGDDPKAAPLWTAWLDFETRRADAAPGDGRPAHVLAAMMADGGVHVEAMLPRLPALAASRPAAELSVGTIEEAAVAAEAEVALAAGRAGDMESALRVVALARRAGDAANSIAAAGVRAPYEAALGKRQWFHVLALQPAALAGWRAYLDFEESAAHSAAAAGVNVDAAWARVERLYGRCLVPCASYAEFWLRYAAFRREYPDAARMAGSGVGLPGSPADILVHAMKFVPHRATLLIAAADACEEAGQGERGLALYAHSATVGEAEGPPLPRPGWAADSAEVGVRYSQALIRIAGPEGVARATMHLRGLLERLRAASASAPALAPLYGELARVHAATNDVDRSAQAWREGAAVCGGLLSYWLAWAASAARHGHSGGSGGVYALALGLDEDMRPRASEGGVEALPREEDRALVWALLVDALRMDPATPAPLITVATDEQSRWATRVAGPDRGFSAPAVVAAAGKKRGISAVL
jgi:hypothetical protein